MKKDAKKKLENDEIFGIYYVKEAPSLTITKNGVSQSILTSLLNTYNQNAYLFKEIARTHPERLTDAVASLQTNGSFITEKKKCRWKNIKSDCIVFLRPDCLCLYVRCISKYRSST